MKNQMRLRPTKQYLVVDFIGELDNTNTFRYKELLALTIDQNEAIRILIFNFAQVTFIDSSGLGLVLGRFNQMKTRDGEMVIAGASSYITKLLNMSGIAGLIRRTENVEEAMGVKQ